METLFFIKKMNGKIKKLFLELNQKNLYRFTVLQFKHY